MFEWVKQNPGAAVTMTIFILSSLGTWVLSLLKKIKEQAKREQVMETERSQVSAALESLASSQKAQAGAQGELALQLTRLVDKVDMVVDRLESTETAIRSLEQRTSRMEGKLEAIPCGECEPVRARK